MINILPIEEKKKHIIEYRLRLGVVSVFAVAALVVSSLVLLIPSYFLTVIKYNDANQELTTLKERSRIDEKRKNVSSQIDAINNKISILLTKGRGEQSAPSQVISGILLSKDSAIKISGITYDATAKQDRIVLSGTAINRDSLAKFVSELKNNPEFIGVELPISSYVKISNIDFSIVVTRAIDKKKQQ